MMDLRELYLEVIIDHNNHPRNHRMIENASRQAVGFNPLCGDKLTVYLQIENDVIKDISFLGCGCAISQASASLMTEALQSKTLTEAHEIFDHFHQMLTRDTVVPPLSIDKLTVLAGVRMFPARVKCATLAWHTLDAAIKKETVTISTE